MREVKLQNIIPHQAVIIKVLWVDHVSQYYGDIITYLSFILVIIVQFVYIYVNDARFFCIYDVPKVFIIMSINFKLIYKYISLL